MGRRVVQWSMFQSITEDKGTTPIPAEKNTNEDILEVSITKLAEVGESIRTQMKNIEKKLKTLELLIIQQIVLTQKKSTDALSFISKKEELQDLKHERARVLKHLQDMLR